MARTKPKASIPPEIDVLLVRARNAATNAESAAALQELDRLVWRKPGVWFSPSARSYLDALSRFEIGPGSKGHRPP